LHLDIFLQDLGAYPILLHRVKRLYNVLCEPIPLGHSSTSVHCTGHEQLR
jgi:hypothetical protein